MPNLVTGVWDSDDIVMVFVVQNSHSPSDAEWAEYCQNVSQHIASPNGAGIAFTDGGAPNSAQRDRMRTLLGAQNPRSAIVTRSLLVRGVVTALSWFNPNTIAFAPERAHAAFAFAGLTTDQIPTFWKAVRDLEARLEPRCLAVAEIDALLQRS